jgi:nucleoside phosphorylase
VNAQITVVCALTAEARPLLRRWRLPRIRERPFHLFATPRHRVIVSGIGAHACAAAVGYAAATQAPATHHLWINFGIAGHATATLGHTVIATRVSHVRAGDVWYPSLLVEPAWPGGDVLTHDQPVVEYPERHYCDMEASAFMAAASRVAPLDLVQVVKVVSDNRQHAPQAVDARLIERLVDAQLDAFENWLERWQTRLGELPQACADALHDELLARWRYTHAERTQLMQLCTRWRLLGTPQLNAELAACRDAQALLACLRAIVDALPLNLPSP